MKGTIKFYKEDKGYGFITSEEGVDYFFHMTKVNGKVTKGDNVDFNVEQGDRGPQAVNVTAV